MLRANPSFFAGFFLSFFGVVLLSCPHAGRAPFLSSFFWVVVLSPSVVFGGWSQVVVVLLFGGASFPSFFWRCCFPILRGSGAVVFIVSGAAFPTFFGMVLPSSNHFMGAFSCPPLGIPVRLLGGAAFLSLLWNEWNCNTGNLSLI